MIEFDESSPYLLGALAFLELVSATLIFAAVVILLIRSSRPGTRLMFISLGLLVLIMIFPMLIDPFMDPDNDGAYDDLMWLLGMASGLVSCLGSYGFFRFALSFRNES
ncbi:MAG: hypothetical protein KTR16_01175 [Acidiferrobacterales bacterium]|nr:hypothetical protein [Acidiferrobacterales bacterium]